MEIKKNEISLSQGIERNKFSKRKVVFFYKKKEQNKIENYHRLRVI